MISYHRTVFSITPNPTAYADGWRAINCEHVNFIAEIVQKYVWSPSLFSDGKRSKSNFIGADWLALDIDSGMSLNQAVKVFKKNTHVIGTTRSHLKPKGNKPPQDRFRVILKLSERITDSTLYEKTVADAIRSFKADESAKDCARMFYPCTAIVSKNCSGNSLDTIRNRSMAKLRTAIDRVKARRQAIYSGVIGEGQFVGWLGEFLNHGVIPCFTNGRNVTIYKATIKLAASGYTRQEIEKYIMQAPYDRNGKGDYFTDEECLRTIKSGYDWFRKH